MGLVSLCASKGTFCWEQSSYGFPQIVPLKVSEDWFLLKWIHGKFLNFSTEMIRLSHNGKDLLIASPLTYPFL